MKTAIYGIPEPLKIAHLVKVTPDKICGLYNTTWELAKGLRDRGVDARLVEIDINSNPHLPKKEDGTWLDNDRSVPIVFTPWVREADVIISHSGYGDEIRQIATEHDIPIIYCAHGRPIVSYLTEKTGGLPLYSYFYNRNKAKDWAAAVTFWPEHIPYMEGLLPDIPLHYVPAPADQSFWQPGETDYTFKGHAGEVNVVLADAWREDVDGFRALHWAILEGRKTPGFKLHVYGKPKNVPGAGALMRTLQDEGTLGWVPGEVHQQELRDAYRAASYGVTCNRIATRTLREMQSCGLEVSYIGDSLHKEVIPDQNFDSAESAEVLHEIIKGVLRA